MRILTVISALSLAGGVSAQTTVSESAVRDWLEGYEAAWETRDADAAARLFTEAALYFETPWSEPFRGRSGIADYWAGVTADQRNIDFEYQFIAVNGPTAVARWNADFELASSGAALAIDGVFVLQFAPDGTVSELREWWVLRP